MPDAASTSSSSNFSASSSSNGEQRDLLIAWLNDAYALEQAMLPVLKNHARDAAGDSELRQRLEHHVEETQRHADLVKQCLDELGAGVSAIKSAAGIITGLVQSASNAAARDELLRNNIADYAAEHFEIACYRSLFTAATDLGERRIAQVCEEILHDEEDMAHFLQQRLPQMTTTLLRPANPDATADADTRTQHTSANGSANPAADADAHADARTSTSTSVDTGASHFRGTRPTR